ncbi:hypothetical protein BDF21DRAFT_425035 [Thamnidium elegans]|uniref:EF-hand domain-containing protein n=1 Tax=Thamnidium elegans TaxID=101142 RepID=A0A8H7SVE9_9FUNG|nr:hypothetical protein INT48_001347 [Thamnidium elegans]KAI8070127.1 hypothetical protein BDF21DRAFT_425035 [Thamnidium elegans]
MSSKRLSFGSHFLSSKKKGDLSDLFASFDKDKDGKISHLELEDMLLSTGVNSSAIPSMLKDACAQKADGSLDFEDFARLMRPTLSDPYRSTSKQQELQEAFDAFDKDGDGTINVTELQAMMEKLGDKLTLQEAQQLIEEVDLDKDGVVNFQEFSIMMGVQQRAAHSSSECTHNHHKYSVRRLFCSHK